MCWWTLWPWFLLNCVYFSAFFCPFSTFFLSFSASFFPFPVLFYPFLPYSALLNLPCLLLSFYILIHILFTLFASYILPYSSIIYFLFFYSYKAFLRLYLSISFCLLFLNLFPCYLFYPCSCLSSLLYLFALFTLIPVYVFPLW